MNGEATVVSTSLPSCPPPREALARVRGMQGVALLESANLDGVSMLMVDPLEILRTVDGATELVGPAGEHLASFPDPFSGLADRVGAMRRPPGGVGQPPPRSFPGGLVGYLAYEAADALETLPAPPTDDLGLPEAWFGLYDHAIVWEHASSRQLGVAVALPGHPIPDAERRLDRLMRTVCGNAVAVGDTRLGETPSSRATVGAPETSLDRERYMAGVRRIRDLIRAGDFFQANLTRRISARTPLSGAELYCRLVEASPGRFSAFLDVSAGAVVSVSPELFLSIRGRRVVTRPIKGTAPRDTDPTRDEALALGLRASAKDTAENVMIVDLLRNDLSRVCSPGSVFVPALNELESHPTVHHLVSTVEGTLAPGVDPVQVLRATFPSGSVTGAPKIRAMAALRALEPVRRGVYTGAIGILGADGHVDLSVAIRTAVVRNGYAHYGTGGGITLSSDPASEWEESELKASAFRSALGI